MRALHKFIAVRVDLTTPTDENRALLERHGQLGPPSVVVICHNGEHATEIHQSIPATEMLETIRDARRTCAAFRDAGASH